MLFRPRELFALCLISILALMPRGASAQTPNPLSNAEPPASAQLLKPAELEALVAPIALYPDSLLSVVMMASTYPLEIVQADRWLGGSNLEDDALKAALDRQSWDDSVKALAATPSVLTMMSTKLDWTQKLGDAVLAQQEDVMDAVQRLRVRAQSNGKLETTKEQVVSTRLVNGKPIIVIDQADPNIVQVPVYDPAVAYGAWPYPEYPPYYWPDYWAGAGYVAGGVLATGVVFGAGYALARWMSGGNGWGGGVNWGNRNLVVNRPIDSNNIGHDWQHRPEHRHGVSYGNADVAQKFAGGNNPRAGGGQRQDFRDRDGNRPGADRAGPGDRARPGGDRAADPASARNANAARRDSARAKGAAKARNRTADHRAGPRPGGGARMGGAGGGPRRDTALDNMEPDSAGVEPIRGRASFAGASRGVGAGNLRGGTVGMGGRGFRGGGRRSDIALKHDVTLLGHLGNGLAFYRFRYNGDDTVYVGVMAQDVEKVMPSAVTRDPQGYLRVDYDRLGLPFQTYDQWMASKTPALARNCPFASTSAAVQCGAERP